VDFLHALSERGVHYMIVGGEAVIYYGHARVTGDIDFFYDRSVENVERLFSALRDFWGGKVPGLVSSDELLEPGLILQFGVPPNRIDLVNEIDGVTFAEAWPNRVPVTVVRDEGEFSLWFVGLQELLKNKRAAARPKDLDDVQFLEGHDE
jgi:hypothetical protein